MRLRAFRPPFCLVLALCSAVSDKRRSPAAAEGDAFAARQRAARRQRVVTALEGLGSGALELADGGVADALDASFRALVASPGAVAGHRAIAALTSELALDEASSRGGDYRALVGHASVSNASAITARPSLVVYTGIFTDDEDTVRDLLKPAGAFGARERVALQGTLEAEVERDGEAGTAQPAVRYVCFTNTFRVVAPPLPPSALLRARWEIVRVPLRPGLGGRKTARYYKAMAHEVLARAGLAPELSLWLDPTHVLLTDAQQLVRSALGTAATGAGAGAADAVVVDIAAHRHNDRRCVYEEVETCAKSGKDAPATLMAQARRYRSLGLACAPPPPVDAPRLAVGELADTACLFRRHTARVRRFNELWWAELRDASVRDQVSFPFVAWRVGASVAALPGTIRDGSALALRPSPHFLNLYHSNVRYAGRTLRFGPATVTVGYSAKPKGKEGEQHQQAILDAANAHNEDFE